MGNGYAFIKTGKLFKDDIFTLSLHIEPEFDITPLPDRFPFNSQ